MLNSFCREPAVFNILITTDRFISLMDFVDYKSMTNGIVTIIVILVIIVSVIVALSFCSM